jgi:hypothetical protein
MTAPEPQASSPKEKKEVFPRMSREAHPVVERAVIPEIPAEIEGVESIAAGEVSLPQPVTDDQGQVVLDNAAPQQVTVTLPLTDEELEQALHLKVIHSIRWLAEWTKRLLRLSSQRFTYRLKRPV